MINLNTLKSWSFVVLVLTAGGAWLTTTGSTISPKYAFVATGLAAGFYALARGFAKFNSDGKPFYRTTEFYVVVIGALTTMFGGFEGHLPKTLFAEVMAALAFMATVAEGLRTPSAKAVGPSGP